MLEISCSIVIFHNPVEELRIAIESFLNCSKNIKLYLVDNSTEDKLRYQFLSPQIEYIFNGKNLGYGAGHNIAIKKAQGRSQYHIVLNPDIEFNPSVLNGLYDFMQQNKNVGLVMPKVLYKNGLTQYLCKRLPSPADLFLRRFIPGKVKVLFKKILAEYELRHKDYNSIMEVPNLSGCFMFIRTGVFSNVGMFDEQYFMYLEDTDLSRRINKYYRTVYYPMESITHGYSKASYKSFKLMKHHLTSSIRYFNKWGWFKDQNRLLINKSINCSSFKPELKFSASKPQLQQDIISVL
jgi:GT2 family glycosyltransferase